MLITYARLRDVIYHNSRSWSLRSWLFKALDDSSKLLHLWVDYGLQLLGGDDVLVGTWTKAQLPPSTVTLQPNRPATQVTGSMISGFLDVLSRHSTGSTMLHNAPQCSTMLHRSNFDCQSSLKLTLSRSYQALFAGQRRPSRRWLELPGSKGRQHLNIRSVCRRISSHFETFRHRYDGIMMGGCHSSGWCSWSGFRSACF